MKCLLINLIVFVTAVNNSDTRKPLFLPQLPVGTYRLNFLGVTRCVSGQSNEKIKFQYYLSKKSANKTEIKGNCTNNIPVDDSLNLKFHLAVIDSIGGWKENAYLYKSPKACSTLKMFLGDAWIPVMKGSGFQNFSCPLPAGLYEATGIDTDLFSTANFPKTLFYGTYRFRYSYTKKDEVYGCFIIVVEIKRPWETNN
ncbi:unnamed protein product [Macrosiphum euphorbiae]|uniref:MD-2-related lipid-recognition domain-containing protein n=1 Tax=Macrosiphum euphorbiae TaxID=13131 RepID=A0AAV0XMW9_9HEMI|nr:unnamed protein product [Macrosiphum euphorbiae]